MEHLNGKYWEDMYQQQSTGWDLGSISTPLKGYVDGLQLHTDIDILVPGAGNGHEAAYIYEQGFTNVKVLDIAPSPLQNFQAANPNFPKTQLIQGNFFEHEGQYDLIIEQTFFCAIDRVLREAYAKKMYELLKPGGKLVGLLFGVEMALEGPPMGGNQEEYEKLFSFYFTILKLEPCTNSIAPRDGKELFMILEKKANANVIF